MYIYILYIIDINTLKTEVYPIYIYIWLYIYIYVCVCVSSVLTTYWDAHPSSRFYFPSRWIQIAWTARGYGLKIPGGRLWKLPVSLCLDHSQIRKLTKECSDMFVSWAPFLILLNSNGMHSYAHQGIRSHTNTIKCLRNWDFDSENQQQTSNRKFESAIRTIFCFPSTAFLQTYAISMPVCWLLHLRSKRQGGEADGKSALIKEIPLDVSHRQE